MQVLGTYGSDKKTAFTRCPLQSKNSNKKSYIPISRILSLACARSPSFICGYARAQPVTPNPSTHCGIATYNLREPRSNADIHGLATRKVYPNTVLPQHAWALTPHFHPYPIAKAVIFCGTFCCQLLGPHPLGGAVPFVVRTFLPSSTAKNDRAVYSRM